MPSGTKTYEIIKLVTIHDQVKDEVAARVSLPARRLRSARRRPRARRSRGCPPPRASARSSAPDGRNLLLGPRRTSASGPAPTSASASRPPPGDGRRRISPASPSRSAWSRRTLAFQQRLLFERLMARHVPLASRRDLKPPAFLHLDPARALPAASPCAAAREDRRHALRPLPRPARRREGPGRPPQALPAAPLRLRLRARPRASPGPRAACTRRCGAARPPVSVG